MTQTRNDVTVHQLRTESQIDPLGIDAIEPRLSWQLRTEQRSTMQTAYQVIVAPTRDALFESGDLDWDSGKVESDGCLNISYAGTPVQSRRSYVWSVRVWTGREEPSAWAEPATWEAGLLDTTDWTARWIEPQQTPSKPELPVSPAEIVDGKISNEANHDLLNPAQLIRRQFTLKDNIAKARIYATAHGVYELELNGRRVGHHELAPEYTAYDKYLMYQTYDVTAQVRDGSNAIGATVADGWYAGRLGITGASANWGDRLGLLLQLEVTYDDGTIDVVASDETFTSSTGPILYADLLIGERYDARLEHIGWSSPGYDDSGWMSVGIGNHSLANLVAQHGDPLRVIADLSPREVLTTPNGETVIDFGQNIAGRVRMRVVGPSGTQVVLEHTQTLDAEGNFFLNILGRNNENRDIYVLNGRGEEQFEPRLTYHGFRYVRITGYPGVLTEDDITAVAISSVREPVMQFATDSLEINQLHSNVQWTMRSNLFSVPTDNPDRERAGWTGDLQIILPTAAQEFDIQGFLTRWLRNLALEQFDDGLIPMVVPYFKGYREDLGNPSGEHTYAGWGDVSVIGPWLTYWAYGDRDVLAQTYEAGKRWVGYVSEIAPTTLTDEDRTDEDRAHLWRATAFHFGDWLTPSSTIVNEHGLYGASNNFANVELVPTIYYAYSSDLLSRIAAILGKDEDSRYYAEQAASIRRGFQKAFVSDAGLLSRDTQGMYVLALQLEMVEPALRPSFINRLVRLIRENGDRLDTGFLSTAYLLPLLCNEGFQELAFDLLFQDRSPSWLYQVRHGATTVWELWTAIEESGNVTKISQNQPGLSTVGNFLYQYVGGIRPASPGYKRVLIEPRIDRRFDYAATRFQSPYGIIATRWERTSSGLRLDIEVPANTVATVRLPKAMKHITEGGLQLSDVEGVKAVQGDDEQIVVDVGSGRYSFVG